MQLSYFLLGLFLFAVRCFFSHILPFLHSWLPGLKMDSTVCQRTSSHSDRTSSSFIPHPIPLNCHWLLFPLHRSLSLQKSEGYTGWVYPIVLCKPRDSPRFLFSIFFILCTTASVPSISSRQGEEAVFPSIPSPSPVMLPKPALPLPLCLSLRLFCLLVHHPVPAAPSPSRNNR